MALTVQSLVAVAAGSVVSLLPARGVHIGAGLVFLASAVVMWIRDEGAPAAPANGKAASFWRTFTTVFGVVFIAEWGDLTQFATAAFAAHERAPVVIFAAATLALWAVTAVAVLVGNRAKSALEPNITKRVAAVLFAGVGVALLAGWL